MKRLILTLLVFFSPVLIGSVRAADQGAPAGEQESSISERDEIRRLIKQSSDEHRRDADKGLGIGQEAYDRAVRLKDTVLIIRALNVIGANHWMLGKYDHAVYAHTDALNLAMAIKSKPDEGQSNNNLGLAYRNLGMTERAEKCFRVAIRIRISIKDSAGLSRSLINLGLVHYETARYDSAYIFNSWSLQLARSINDSLLIASNLYYLGRVEMGRGNAMKALKLMREGLELYVLRDDRNGISLASSDIARVQLDSGLIQEAEQNAKHALRTAFLLNSRFAIREATDVLTAIYAAKADYRTAYEYMTMYRSADDSLRSEAAVLRAAQIDIERAIALREKELIYEAKAKALEVEAALHKATDARNYLIAGSLLLAILLTLLLIAYRSKQKASDVILEQNVLVEEANKDLSREIETRERLFSIIAHDLRGPIGTIANMLEFVSHNEQATESEKTSMIDAARLSAHASYSTLNRLLDWAHSQRKEIQFNPESNDIYDTAQEVIALLGPQAKAKEIILSWECPQGLRFEYDKQMIVIVLENLISNAIKFTSAQGHVQLRVEQAVDHCSIIISDDGQGMDEERVKRIQDKSTIIPKQGTAAETGHGLGLSLCNRFIDLHGGDLKVESKIGKGTTFFIRIPLRQIHSLI